MGTFYLPVLCQNSAGRKRWNVWRCFRFSVLTQKNGMAVYSLATCYFHGKIKRRKYGYCLS